MPVLRKKCPAAERSLCRIVLLVNAAYIQVYSLLLVAEGDAKLPTALTVR
jgi:hypothetical protein